MNSKSERELSHQKFIRVQRLLELIEGANRSIELESSQNSTSSPLVKQYLHLKQKYIEELVELLKKYKISLQIPDAA